MGVEANCCALIVYYNSTQLGIRSILCQSSMHIFIEKTLKDSYAPGLYKYCVCVCVYIYILWIISLYV